MSLQSRISLSFDVRKSTKAVSSVPTNKGTDIPMAMMHITMEMRHEALVVSWVRFGCMIHRYRSIAMAIIAKEDINIGVA